MNPPAGHLAPGAMRQRIRARHVIAIAIVLVVVAILLDTTYVDVAAEDPTTGDTFDAGTFGSEVFPQVSAAVQTSAVDLGEVLSALEADEDAASEEYGYRTGTGPYNFPVSAVGVAGAPNGGMLPIDIEGISEGVTTQIQIGPVISGTSLRDVVDFITFDDFVNQMEYAGAASALNGQVRDVVLVDLESAAIEGAEVAVVGAFTRTNPALVTITPVSIDVRQ